MVLAVEVVVYMNGELSSNNFAFIFGSKPKQSLRSNSTHNFCKQYHLLFFYIVVQNFKLADQIQFRNFQIFYRISLYHTYQKMVYLNDQYFCFRGYFVKLLIPQIKLEKGSPYASQTFMSLVGNQKCKCVLVCFREKLKSADYGSFKSRLDCPRKTTCHRYTNSFFHSTQDFMI